MKSNINIKVQSLIIGVMVVVVTGCSDFLEEVNPTDITLDAYFKNADHARTAVNSIYPSLRSVRGGGYGGGAWLMTEMASGLADTELGQAENSLIIRDLDNTGANGYSTSHWNSNYLGIQNANLAIAKIPEIEMNENLKKQLLGEAKFLRAHYYYQLVRHFGDVPLITGIVDLGSDELYPARSSVADVYAQIVQDLTDAEDSGLPFNDASGRVTLGAIKTLLSSVYLTMAGYPLQMGASHYTLAAAKAKEVIDSNEYALFDSYDDLHDPRTNNSGEFIFQVQYQAGIAPSSWQPLILPLVGNISEISAETGAIFADQNFIATYEAGDARVEEKGFYFREFTVSGNRETTINLGAYRLWKHFDVEANLTTASPGINWTLYRYAEVLLIHAEALNETGTQDYAGINAIRVRADLAPLSGLSQAEFREAVWKEKFHELSYEDKAWFDMVRLRKAYNLSTNEFDDFVGHQFIYGPTLTERELLFPIPQSELDENPSLGGQNTGYN
ncbi:MAG: RagB/SusD family nutrient uptake outer membrane protein [Cyclobacteriaceae bacterium]